MYAAGPAPTSDASRFTDAAASAAGLTWGALGAVAFVGLRRRLAAHAARRTPGVLMVDIPRITLPAAVTDVLKDLELKNPNDMNQAEYNSYSGAAILGTLVLFVLFGVIGVFDISGALFDFIFSALIGGGLMAFLALNKSTSEFAGKAGDKLLSAADSLGEKLGGK